MTPLDFMTRKVRQGWTDGEIMVLLQLAQLHTATCTEIAAGAGQPMTTVWRAIRALTIRQIVQQQIIRTEKYYSLSDHGQTALLLLLK